MTGLAGWCSGTPSSTLNQNMLSVVAQRINRINRVDPPAVHSAVALGAAAVVSSSNHDGHLFCDGKSIVVVHGSAYFRDEALAEIARRYGIARAVFQGVVNDGAKVLDKMAGTFAVAISDGSSNETLIAVD